MFRSPVRISAWPPARGRGGSRLDWFGRGAVQSRCSGGVGGSGVGRIIASIVLNCLRLSSTSRRERRKNLLPERDSDALDLLQSPRQTARHEPVRTRHHPSPRHKAGKQKKRPRREPPERYTYAPAFPVRRRAPRCTRIADTPSVVLRHAERRWVPPRPAARKALFSDSPTSPVRANLNNWLGWRRSPP